MQKLGAYGFCSRLYEIVLYAIRPISILRISITRAERCDVLVSVIVCAF